MNTFNEGRHATEGLIWEEESSYSREVITIASGSGVVAPGAVLGKYTSGANAGKYSFAPANAADPDVGNQTAVAIALYGCDATSADQKIVAVVRDAIWNKNTLSYHSSVDQAGEKTTKMSQLSAVGILCR